MKFLLRELTRTPTANKDTHRNLYAQNLGGCPGSAASECSALGALGTSILPGYSSQMSEKQGYTRAVTGGSITAS